LPNACPNVLPLNPNLYEVSEPEALRFLVPIYRKMGETRRNPASTVVKQYDYDYTRAGKLEQVDEDGQMSVNPNFYEVSEPEPLRFLFHFYLNICELLAFLMSAANQEC
jgi:hypothetical protein